MPLQATSGAASYDAFGGGVPVVPNYIEDVFSTYLYQGTGASQTITNGIDLSTKGGLVWFKSRSGAYNHALIDTVRGGGQVLSSNTASPQADYSPQGISAFNSNGFTFGTTTAELNNASNTYVSWSFAEAPKFFDIVTAARVPGQTNARISHNLGSVPGFVIVKSTDYSSESWRCYHQSLGRGSTIQLNLTDAVVNIANYWGTSDPTSTDFGINWNLFSGDNYVFYFFAHDAGGFGLTGTDNVISCGSYTGNGSTDGPVIDLGYEPQWLLIKSSSASSTAWTLIDNMRGMTVGGADAYLKPNSSDAETTSLDLLSPTATGFKLTSTLGLVNGANDYIYIAIRRGPMKVPTDATKVFYPTTYTGTGVARTFSGFGFPPDFEFSFSRGGSAAGDGNGSEIYDKLRGTQVRLLIPSTGAETSGTEPVTMIQDGISVGATVNSYINASGFEKVLYALRRAPSYFDEVCYTGTGSSATSFSHNLGVAPELMIIKSRDLTTRNWIVTSNFTSTNYLLTTLNTTSAGSTFNYTDGASIEAQPTSTTLKFTGGVTAVNGSGSTYVAYLFATCAGVSKVGSYTGTGTTKQVDCGFTGGARFVLIKKTSGTGSWYVWDSARGIVSGNDPYLLLNSTAAEVTSTDYIDTYSAGFEISSTAPSEINENGGSFIFLAIS